MKVCEIEGHIRGFEYDSDFGFMFQGEWINGHYPRYTEEEIKFPYNVDRPDVINLEKIRNKKFKLTIEIIEDEDSKEDQNWWTGPRSNRT